MEKKFARCYKIVHSYENFSAFTEYFRHCLLKMNLEISI